MKLRVVAALIQVASKLTKALQAVLLLATGVVATALQLSPLSSNTVIGNVLFSVVLCVAAAILLIKPIVFALDRRGSLRVISTGALLRGAYLERIAEIGRSVMGEGHADADTLRDRLLRCPDGITVITRRPERLHVREKVVGYFTCWTISEDAVTKFDTGIYNSGLDLEGSEFVTISPGAAYITMVYGKDLPARRLIFQLMEDQLHVLFNQVGAPRVLLARPATYNGELLMRKIGMSPLPILGSSVWSVDGARVGLLKTLGLV